MSDYDQATLYVKPAPSGAQYGICIGDWRNRTDVFGFDTAQDAYYWCVQTLHIDPLVSAGVPEKFRQWVHESGKPEHEFEGLPLFTEGTA